MKLAAILSAAALLAASGARAFSYPALDTTSHWSIQNFGFSTGQGFYIQGASKKVWLSPGQPSTRTVFYNLAALGARKDGVDCKLLSQDFMGEM